MTPNLAGLSAFPDRDLVAELRERGYSVNKDVTDKEIQDILIGFRDRDYKKSISGNRGYSVPPLRLGEAIERIKCLMNEEIK